MFQANNRTTRDFVLQKMGPELKELIRTWVNPEMILILFVSVTNLKFSGPMATGRCLQNIGILSTSSGHFLTTVFKIYPATSCFHLLAFSWLYNESPVKDTIVTNDRFSKFPQSPRIFLKWGHLPHFFIRLRVDFIKKGVLLWLMAKWDVLNIYSENISTNSDGALEFLASMGGTSLALTGTYISISAQLHVPMSTLLNYSCFLAIFNPGIIQGCYRHISGRMLWQLTGKDWANEIRDVGRR